MTYEKVLDLKSLKSHLKGHFLVTFLFLYFHLLVTFYMCTTVRVLDSNEK